jgi:hypothetical protein
VPWIIAGGVIVVVIGGGAFFANRLLVLTGNSEQILDDAGEQAWTERGERYAE